MLVANIFPFLIFRGLVGGGSDSIIFWNALVPFLIHIKVCCPWSIRDLERKIRRRWYLLTFTHIFLRGIHGKISTDYTFWLFVCLSADRIPNLIRTILFDINLTSVTKTFVK